MRVINVIRAGKKAIEIGVLRKKEYVLEQSFLFFIFLIFIIIIIFF